jgi:hypothetical protein
MYVPLNTAAAPMAVHVGADAPEAGRPAVFGIPFSWIVTTVGLGAFVYSQTLEKGSLRDGLAGGSGLAAAFGVTMVFLKK